jgi:hypothetical protein
MTPPTNGTNHDPNASFTTNDLDHLSYLASSPNSLLTSAKAVADAGWHAAGSGSNSIVPGVPYLRISPETSPCPEPPSSRRNRAKELRERYEAMESQAEDNDLNEDELDKSSDDTYASPAPLSKKAKISRTQSTATVTGSTTQAQLESAAQLTGTAKKRAAKRTKGTPKGVSNLNERAPASGNLKETPRAHPVKFQYESEFNGQAKAIANILSATLKSTLEIAKLRAEARFIQAGGITDEVRAEKEKDRELQRLQLAHRVDELKFRREELTVRRLEAKARLLQFPGYHDSE